MTYHIVIKTERRVSTPEDPRELAVPISASVPTGKTIAGPMGEIPEYVAGQQQLHTMVTATEIYAGRIKSAMIRGDEEESLALQEQAAMGVTPDFSDDQFVMVAEWDGVSPYIIQHKGDYATRNLSFAGWPSITKEQYDAIPAPDPVV